MKTLLIRKLCALCMIAVLSAASLSAYADQGCSKGEKKGCQVKEKQCDAEKKEACKEKESCGEKKTGCCKKDSQGCPAK